MLFKDFAVNPKCIHVLDAQGISEPTPVQAEAIPPALEGRDVLAVAQTGTGKTLAFSLPALTRLAEEKPRRNRMLVLTPTRELANQVFKVVDQLGRKLGLHTACIYGGVGMEPQTKALRRGCDIIIATPGRLLDHMNRRNVRFDELSVLVLDEADRMLDMGFLPDIRRILSDLPKDHQTMLFSATFPSGIRSLAKDFQRDPVRVDITPVTRSADAVRQCIYTVDSAAKTKLLTTILGQPEVTSVIVFSRTKHRTDRLARALGKAGVKSEAIHGGRSQAQRERALDGFRKGRFNVLVATDVAARGIDVKGVSHVVNFDMPNSVDDYVHRIGRTGRASATGDAITFVSPDEFMDLGAIEKALGKALTRVEWEGAVNVPSIFSEKKQAPKRGIGARRTGRPGAGKGRRPRRRAVAAR